MQGTVFGILYNSLKNRNPQGFLHANTAFEATNLFKRRKNVFNFLGDIYLYRTYRLLSSKFHPPAWKSSTLRNLEVINDVYKVVADQAAALKT